MHPIIKLVKDIVKKIWHAWELRKYNNFTISEYFRKQGAIVGENCFIVPREIGTEPYLVNIGNHVCISEKVQLHTHDGGTWVFREQFPDLRVFGPIVIEDNCLLGVGAQILPNVRIGKNSIIGAGAVVISDIPPNSIAIGVPARRFGSIEKYREKCIQQWKLQRPKNLHPQASLHYELATEGDLIRKELKQHLTKLFFEQMHSDKQIDKIL